MITDEFKADFPGFELKQSVTIDEEGIALDDTGSGLEIKVVFVNTVNHSNIPSDFGFDDYINQVKKGDVSFEKHDEFLHIIYEPFKKADGVRSGFWDENEQEGQPKNLVESYSDRFTECFGDKGRNIVTSPTAVREIVERMQVNGKPYIEYYGLPVINKMNYLEIVFDIIENISCGEVARSFANKDQEHIIVTFQPIGKDYINVYLPEMALSESSDIVQSIAE